MLVRFKEYEVLNNVLLLKLNLHVQTASYLCWMTNLHFLFLLRHFAHEAVEKVLLTVKL